MTGLPVVTMAADTNPNPAGTTLGTDRGGITGTDRGGRAEPESENAEATEGTVALLQELIEALFNAE